MMTSRIRYPQALVVTLMLGCAPRDSGEVTLLPDANFEQRALTAGDRASNDDEAFDRNPFLELRRSMKAEGRLLNPQVSEEVEVQLSTTGDGRLRDLFLSNAAWPVAPPSSSPEETARAALARWKPLLGLDDIDTAIRHRKTASDGTFFYVHFDQLAPGGRRIFSGAGLLVVVTGNGSVRQLSAQLEGRLPAGEPTFTADQALQVVSMTRAALKIGSPELGVVDLDKFKDAQETGVHLVWRVYSTTEDLDGRYYFIDAASGQLLHVAPAHARAYSIETWQDFWRSTGQQTLIYDNTPYYFYGSWPGDTQAVNTAEEHLDNFLYTTFGRDGWDNNQLPPQYNRMRAYADSAPGFSPQWIHNPGGNPDPDDYSAVIIPSWGACDDVVSHEFFHGIQYLEAGENTSGERRDIEEHIGDVFGESVEAHFNSGVPDWRFGTGANCACHLRSLSDPENPGCASPTCDLGLSCGPSAGHYSNKERWGSEYSASTFSKAFYLLGRPSNAGPVTYAGVTVYPIGAANAAKVWYHTMVFYLTETTDYLAFRNNLEASAQIVFSGDYRYLRTKQALAAVGLWTSEQWDTGVQTDRRMALERFTVSGQSRLYALYKEPVGSAPRLRVAYRLCAIGPGCTWTAPVNISWTGAGVDATVYDGKLWVFYKYDISDQIYFKTMDNTGAWSGTSTLNVTTDNDVEAVVHDGELWVLYKQVGSSALRYKKYTPAGGWSAEGTVPGVASKFGPGAVSYNGSLRVYFVNDLGGGATTLKSIRLAPGSIWAPQETVPNQSATVYVSSPSAEVFKNRVHVAVRDSSKTNMISLCLSGTGCTYRPGEHTNMVRTYIQGQSSPATITLDQADGALYALTLRTTGGTSIHWKESE